MEPKGSLPRLQLPATCPNPEPDQRIPAPPTHFLKFHLNIIPHLCLGLPSSLIPSGFPIKTLYVPLLSCIFRTIHICGPFHFTVYT